jgi:protein-disulfide isomerase
VLHGPHPTIMSRGAIKPEEKSMRSMKYLCLFMTLFVVCITMSNLIPGTDLARVGSASGVPSEIGTLQEDVERLKTELAEIKKQLADLRQLLSQRAAQPANVMVKVSVGDSPSLGQPDAPVTLVEFSDYQCPFCGRFFKQTFTALKTDYIDTGKLRYVFRDFPLDTIHPQARKAAEAAHCAGAQGKYWEMHDTLFKNQSALKVDNLKAFARDLGLDTDAFNACLDQGTYAEAVNQHLAAGSQAGIAGTPGFFIGKTSAEGTLEATFIKGAQPITAFRQVIDGLLEGQKP